MILAFIGTCVVCTCCCALLLPGKSGGHELSGVVLQDKEGSQKVINLPPRTHGRIEEIEVICLRRVSSKGN
uniref:Putative secreted protein n=1 Tax=Rhipicephalus microplus TaxID=6941 RepID=A0A6M2DBM5_RHIMP